MKKSIKSILALVLVAIMSTMCVHAEDSQLTLEERIYEHNRKWDAQIPLVSYDDAMGLDYYYRWTVDVQLTDEEKDSYIYELSDNGKVRISYIVPKKEWPYDEEVIDSDYFALVAFKGKKELVLPAARNSSGAVIYTGDDSVYKYFDYTYINMPCDYGAWKTDKDKAYGAYIKFTNKFIVAVSAEEYAKALDTTTNLTERHYYFNISRGRYENYKIIEGKAVTYPDMKKPLVPDEVFMEAGAEGEGDRRKPLDISVEDMRKAPADPFEDNPVELPPECASHEHGTNILYGHSTTYDYRKYFPEGRIVFNVNVPKECFPDISSDGELTVVIQRYQQYYVSRDRKATDLDYKWLYGIEDTFVVTLAGDLSEKLMYNDYGFFYGKYYLQPICFWEDGRFTYRYDPNDKSVPYIKVERPKEYAETGIKRIGIVIDDQYYSVPMEEALIDFDVEVAMAKNRELAPYLVRYIRADREVNNELENVITDEMIAKFAKYPPKNIGLSGNVEENKEIENKETEKEPETKPENPTDTPTESKDDIKILLDKLILDFSDQNPILEDGRVLVPMRAIFEALGATVEWDEETRTITARKGDTIITLQIGKNEIVKNGETVELDTKAQIMNDRTLVPLRAVSESFDNKVEWNGEEKTVTIVTDET